MRVIAGEIVAIRLFGLAKGQDTAVSADLAIVRGLLVQR